MPKKKPRQQTFEEKFQARELELDSILCPNLKLRKFERDIEIMTLVCDLTGISPHDWNYGGLGELGRQKYKEKAVEIIRKSHLANDTPAEALGELGRQKDEDVESDQARKRATKKETVLKTFAAILHKMENPGATLGECAAAADISKSTLQQRDDWVEWRQRVETALANGEIAKLKSQFDARTGEFLPFVDDTRP